MRQGCFRSAGCGSSGFGRRANLLKSYFSGFQPAEMHFFRRKNRFLLREASRTSDSAFPASSSFYHLLTPKGGTKSVRQAKSSGNGRRMHLKRYADKLAPAFSTAQPPPVLLPAFSQCGVCCALRATMILISFYSVLAGLRPAGSHCKNNLILTSGSIPHLRLGVSCKERIYHLLSPKGGAKSVRRAPPSGSDGGSP